MLHVDEADPTIVSLTFSDTVTRADINAVADVLNAKLDRRELALPLAVDLSQVSLDDFTFGAMVRDAKLELSLLSRLGHMPRVAIVSDASWLSLRSVRWSIA